MSRRPRFSNFWFGLLPGATKKCLWVSLEGYSARTTLEPQGRSRFWVFLCARACRRSASFRPRRLRLISSASARSPHHAQAFEHAEHFHHLLLQLSHQAGGRGIPGGGQFRRRGAHGEAHRVAFLPGPLLKGDSDARGRGGNLGGWRRCFRMGQHHPSRFAVARPLAKSEIEYRGERRFIHPEVHRRIAGEEPSR